MISATLLCTLFVIGGLWTGYSLNLLAGPTIIVWAGGSYLLVTAARAAGRLRRA
jgi:ABC-type Mn2+/Zn2+ transport system permease subunit